MIHEKSQSPQDRDLQLASKPDRASLPWTPAPIWRPALLYGASYAVFGVYTHRVAASIIEAVGAEQGRRLIVLGLCAGLMLVVPAFVYGLHRLARRRGAPAARISITAAVSGAAAVVIAIATVMAFSFGGVSMVLALLLMRALILIVSPVIDVASRRPIRRHSVVALALSLCAVFYSLSGLPRDRIGEGFFAVLGVYLLGYVVRLSIMSREAKTLSPGQRASYAKYEFTALIAGALLLSAMILLRDWSVFAGAPGLSLKAAAIGLAYGFVLLGGTLVYLHPREHSFTVPVNRAASLLGGMGGAAIGAAIGVSAAPPAQDFISGAIIVIALAVLGAPYGRRSR